MCDKLKKYFETIGENKEIVVTFLGFFMAFMIYLDFKEFTKTAQEIQLEQTVALREITIRLTNLESRINISYYTK